MTPTQPWWKSAVVYQIYPRSFADGNGDGMGDLRGVIGKLDYLHSLGVDVVWLSPFYASPQDDNGYDISDYRSVDPMFGTLEDFDELAEGLHSRGMKLVVDIVVNHTSDEHPWFVESASSLDNPKRDWYWWRDPRPGHVGGEPGAEPTNWASFFSGPTWEYDAATNQYYLHLFSRKQPDLNWENPEVREAVYDMMRWWRARGVDGFRMDVINLISKDVSLPDGVLRDGELHADGFPFYGDGPRLREYLHEMNLAVFGDDDGDHLIVGETPRVTIASAREHTDAANREVDMVFHFEHVGLDHGPGGKFDYKPLDMAELIATLASWQDGLAGSGWNSLYWNNHDQPRAVSRFGCDERGAAAGGDHCGHWSLSAKALAAVLYLQRGTPYIYQGEELGMTNTDIPSADAFQDIESIAYYREAVEMLGRDPEQVLAGMRPISRDNARTPVQWDAGANAGFTTGTPWQPVTANYERINAAAQVDDPDSVFSFYRKVIALRHENSVVAYGDLRMISAKAPTVMAYERSEGASSLLVIANLSCVPADVSDVVGGLDPEWDTAPVVLANYQDTESERGVSQTLRPWEVRVLNG